MTEEELKRRHADFCPHHEENTKMIGKQGFAIGRHSGQWTLLLWILGLGIGGLITVAGLAYKTQQESIDIIATSVHSIDKVMTAYVASHTMESLSGFRRINHLEERTDLLHERFDTFMHTHESTP
jgi:hypothetical protein